jgi:hypothetical protein
MVLERSAEQTEMPIIGRGDDPQTNNAYYWRTNDFVFLPRFFSPRISILRPTRANTAPSGDLV